MSGKYERTFEVRVPVERAWRAFTEPRELETWYAERVQAWEAIPGGRLAYGMEGYPLVEGTVQEVEPLRRLRFEEGPGLLPGTTQITVVFESIESGTRITITHAGFGEGGEWIDELQSHTQGWNQAIADLVLWLETGVRFPRFHAWKSMLGVATLDVPAGVQVIKVVPDTFAAQCGLEAGDLLLEVGGAGVFDRTDLWVLTREHHPGDELEAAYLRDGRLQRATGRLTGRRAV